MHRLTIDMITPLGQPMDPLDNMTPEEAKALEDWEDHFRVSIICDSSLTSRQSIYLLGHWLNRAKSQAINFRILFL